MSTIEVRVPDIGDFADVPVIEIFVKPGDTVAAEASLITLESDKATMDVPSPAAGTVKELKVKVGDKVAEGVVILTLEAATAAPSPRPSAADRNESAEAPSPQPSPAGGRGSAEAPSPQPSPAGGRECRGALTPILSRGRERECRGARIGHSPSPARGRGPG